MPIFLESEADIQLERAVNIRLQERLANAARPDIKKSLDTFYEVAADFVRKTGNINFTLFDILQRMPKERRIENAILPHTARAAKTYAIRAINAVRKNNQKQLNFSELISNPSLSVQLTIDDTWWWEAYLLSLEQATTATASLIDKTSLNEVQTIVRAAAIEGLSLEEIADNLTTLTSSKRALIIARTETHSAAQAGLHSSTNRLDEELNLRLNRKWIAIEDSRTRPTHVAADGQVRGLQEPFDVGGSKLRFPGDPLGSVREIIMCRCTAGYVRNE